jgi:hypothetical protein
LFVPEQKIQGRTSVNQQALFHETIFDALGADIAAAGGFKAVSSKLWPAENPLTAAAKLRNSINPDQPHKLSPDEALQIKRLAAEAGSHATVQFEAQQLGYRFEWVNPVDEQEQLDRDIRDLLQIVLKKQEARERAVQRAESRSAIGAVPR